jgi:hypothetical protein
MKQLYLYSFNRRSTLVDHDGVRSCQTERVNQLIRKRWWGYEIIEEEIVPDDQFIPVLHGTSNWISRFASTNAIVITDIKTITKPVMMRIYELFTGRSRIRLRLS